MAEFPTDKRQRRMEIDVERYQTLLDSEDLTLAQKHEIVRALWTFICLGIDLGLGVYPAQTVLAERARAHPDR